MESQETPNHQNNTEEEQVGDLTLPDFKFTSKLIEVIKTVL